MAFDLGFSVISYSIFQWGWEQKLPLISLKMAPRIEIMHIKYTQGFLGGVMHAPGRFIHVWCPEEVVGDLGSLLICMY